MAEWSSLLQPAAKLAQVLSHGMTKRPYLSEVRSAALVATVVAALLIAGCGSSAETPSNPGAADLQAELTATCGPITFNAIPPDVGEFEQTDDDAQAALDELVNGPTGVEAVGLDTDYQWTIASRTDTELTLFGQGETADGPTWAYAQFDNRDGRWTPTSWGGCPIIVEAPNFSPAKLAFDPDRPPDPTTTELPVLIKERECASGRAPTDRQVVPVVTETDESVSIVVVVARPDSADCPENPWHPITISLESPLGSRQVYDAHELAPRTLGSPEEADSD